MPSYLSWLLLPANQPETEPVPEPSTASPDLPCPQEATTQQGFLDAFDRLFPHDYLSPMETGQGPGYELFQSFAKVGERLSTAVARLGCAAFIGSSSGAGYATVPVLLSRPTSGAGAVVVNTGTVVTCSKSGRRFVLQSDTAFGGGDVGPFTVIARAVEPGYEYNVAGQRQAANGDLLPGSIDTIEKLVETPAFGDPSVFVVQIDDAAGGAPAALDLHGQDRNIKRQAGESDRDYRIRIRSLPDTVSPAAMRRAAVRAFKKWKHTVTFLETWQMSTAADATMACDLPDSVAPNLTNRWLDLPMSRGAFVFVLPTSGCVDMVGCAYDDSAAVAGSFDSPDTLGPRAVPAFDVPTTLAGGLNPPCYSGVDLPHDAIYAGFWNVVQAIKPAGVIADFELQGQ